MITKLWSEVKYIVSLCLTVKNLGILLLVTIIDSFASGFLIPIFAPFLNEKGIDFAQIGMIFSVAAVLPLFLQPLMGGLSDRIGRKILMVGPKLFVAVVTPLYIFLNNVWAIGVLMATNQTLERSAAPAGSAMMADVAPTKDRATVFGALGAINNMTYGLSLFLCGLLLAGLTVGGVVIMPGLSMTAMFWLSASLYIIAAVLLAIFLKETAPVLEQKAAEQAAADAGGAASKKEAAAETPAEQPPRPTVGDRIKQLFLPFVELFRSGRTMQGLLLFQFFWTFSLGIYPIFIPLLAQKLGAPDHWLGPIVAVSWITYAVGQPVGGRLSDRSGARKRFILAGLIGLLICNTGIGLAPYLQPEDASGPGLALLLVVIFWGLLGIPDSMSRPSLSALLVDVVPAADRGKAFGILGSASTLAAIIAPASYGYLAQYVSLSIAFLLTSCSLAGTVVVVALMITDPRTTAEQPAEPEEPEPAPA